MNLVLEKKHENRIEFLVDGITSGFANMIRRYSISRIPVLAIDTVVFYDNSSPFWDEYIAHRLGLMPIITPAKTAEGTEVLFSLDAAGPKVVYSGDMKSSDDSIKMGQEKIVIATLGENQTLRFEGKAVVGTAQTHARFQSGLMAYGEKDGKFKFFVESFYQMTPKEVVKRGCEVIERDIDTVINGVSKKPKKAATKKTAAKKGTKKSTKKKEETKEKEE
ncbi:MAG: hypothetical protein ABII71_00880 [Candidatus Micrarchaeota archaeon]